MAREIKTIPMLTDKVAANFIKKADSNFEKKGSIDFSKQVKLATKILAKAKLK